MRDEWETALRLLQPTQAELERGLSIHYDTLVAESYSLGLHSTVDCDFLNHEIQSGATPLEFKDLIEEEWMLGWLRSIADRQRFSDAWHQAGVSCLFINAGEEGNHPLRLLKRLARYIHLIDSMPELLRKVNSVADIRQARVEGKYSFCLTTNGVPVADDYIDVADAMQYIRVFAQLGVKMMHLTYNRRNLIGDGCAEPFDGGLSAFGHEVVHELNRLGIIIDLAHTGWRTCLDTCKASSQPVIVSHSAVHELSGHIRAKPDEVIRAVVESGGVFGITNYPAFLGRSGDIVAFIDHLDYAINRYGAEGVCVGTDRVYRVPQTDLHEKLQTPPKARKQWEKLWPAQDPIFSPEWHKPEQTKSLSWTNWPLFTVGLIQRGHSEETIRKVLGENLLRVAGQVWKV